MESKREREEKRGLCTVCPVLVAVRKVVFHSEIDCISVTCDISWILNSSSEKERSEFNSPHLDPFDPSQ